MLKWIELIVYCGPPPPLDRDFIGCDGAWCACPRVAHATLGSWGVWMKLVDTYRASNRILRKPIATERS